MGWIADPQARIAPGKFVAEGMEFHMPKGFVCFATAVLVGVQLLNLETRGRRRRKARPVQLGGHMSHISACEGEAG